MEPRKPPEATEAEIKAFLNKRLNSLSLMNDYFFSAFMQNNHDCMETALRAFTGDNSIKVLKVKTQYPIENFRPAKAEFIKKTAKQGKRWWKR
mgnify:CR=1 FL=1